MHKAIRRPLRLRLELLEERNLLSVALLDNFDDTSLSAYASILRYSPSAVVLDVAAQDGRKVLDKQDGYEWLVRGDAAAQVRQGQTLSVWTQFADAADGRAYVGFGARPQRASGTYSLVLAANTNQLILQLNSSGYSHSNLAAVGQKYEANRWYRVEIAWGFGGSLTGRLYDSDGVTLLNEVQATNNTFSAGGIAFRAFGSDKYFRTVVLDDDATATPQELAEAGDGLVEGWDPAKHPPQPTNLDSGGNAEVPWNYTDWTGSNRDVELMTYNSLMYVATVDGRVGLAGGNISRVIPGTSPIDWGPAHYSGSGSPPPETPLLSQFLFRQLPGETTRLIGTADMKHFFAPSILGPGETDAYGSGLNAIQSYFIPGSELNPVTGMLHRRSHFGAQSADGINLYQGHGHANRIEHLLQVAVDDLDPSLYPEGTRWYLLGHLWVAGDQNTANNSRWVEVRPQRNGSSFSFSYPAGAGGQLDFRTIPDLYQPAGPFVLAQSPRGVVAGSVQSMRIRFNTPIDVSTFTPDQVLLVDTNFEQIAVNEVVPVFGSGDREFEIFFDAQATPGDYYFYLGLGILDLYGNPPDQDQNGAAGEESDWYLGSFTIAAGPGGSPTGSNRGGAELVWGLVPHAPLSLAQPAVEESPRQVPQALPVEAVFPPARPAAEALLTSPQSYAAETWAALNAAWADFLDR